MCYTSNEEYYMKRLKLMFIIILVFPFLFFITSCSNNDLDSSSPTMQLEGGENNPSTPEPSNVNSYDVSFIVEGQTYASKKVEENEFVDEPEEPVFKNYKFLGWYLGNQEWDFNNEVSKNTDLVAKFDYGYDYLGTTVVRVNDYGKTLDRIYIAENITNIGSSSFSGMQNLKTIDIPNSVTNIENFAFNGCSNLNNIIIPGSVSNIGSYAFLNCSSLSLLTLSEGVKYIGTQVFRGCSLGDFVIPNSVLTIEENAFYGAGITKITLPFTGKSRESLNDEAHYSFTGLNASKVVISNGISTIKPGSFADCYGLTEVILAPSVKIIGNGAFDTCINLVSINIHDYIEEIGNYAFEYCYGLEEVTFSEKLNKIGIGAFYNCQGLITINFKSKNLFINNDAFQLCSNLDVINISSIEDWCNVQFSNELSNPTYHTSSLYLNDNKIKNIIIPNSVKHVHNYAFYLCSSIESISFNDSLETIGNYAFTGCNKITEMNIPSSVISIGEDIFNRCSNLETLTIPLYDSLSYYFGYALTSQIASKLKTVNITSGITKVPNGAFRDCSKIKQVSLPNTIEEIGANAFYGCDSLDIIVVSNSVLKVDEYAFFNSELKPIAICYQGTVEEWNDIEVASNNNLLIDTNIYFYRFNEPLNEGNYWHYLNGEIVIW